VLPEETMARPAAPLLVFRMKSLLFIASIISPNWNYPKVFIGTLFIQDKSEV
jgi:hypothetical protein